LRVFYLVGVDYQGEFLQILDYQNDDRCKLGGSIAQIIAFETFYIKLFQSRLKMRKKRYVSHNLLVHLNLKAQN
jgi:hypothetical protein